MILQLFLKVRKRYFLVQPTSSRLVSDTPKLEIPSFFLDLSSSMKRSSKSPLWALASGKRKLTSVELSSINLAFFTNFLTNACNRFLVNWRNSSESKSNYEKKINNYIKLPYKIFVTISSPQQYLHVHVDRLGGNLELFTNVGFSIICEVV